MTIENLMESYLKKIQGNGSTRAFANKILLVKGIIKDVGQWNIEEATEQKLSEYINLWTSKTYCRGNRWHRYTQTHIDKIYQLLCSAFKDAARTGLLPSDPTQYLCKPVSQAAPKDDIEPYTINEMRMIMQAAKNSSDSFLRVQAAIFFSVGIRPGEMWAIKFSDFVTDEAGQSRIKIRRALSVDKVVDVSTKKVIMQKPLVKSLKNEIRNKKNYQHRELVISKEAMHEVNRLREAIMADKGWTENRRKEGTQDYLFANHAGRILYPESYTLNWKRCMEATGMKPGDYSLYRFRHTYCTRLFKQYRLDPKLVQRMMGDNDMTMVLRVYNAINNDDIIAASGQYASDIDTQFA